MDIVNRIEQHFPALRDQMHSLPDRFAPDWLMQAASAQSGLTDFGNDSFLDPLQRLCRSLDDEADLNPYGRLMCAGVIRNQLVNRLLLVAARKTAPARFDTDLIAPIIVTGLPRTGTTFLHRLLAADPGHASLPYWQVSRPIPLGPDDTPARRIAEAQAFLDIRKKLTPELDGVHMIQPEAPEECFWMTSQSMVSRLFWNLAPVYGYQHWVSRADKTEKYRDYADQLRFLQSEYPGQRLVLKAPDHNDGLTELLTALPEARVIITHRDIVEQMGSYFSLGRTTRTLAINRQDIPREAQTIVDMTEVAIDSMARARARFGDRIMDIRYADIMADPLSGVERIYDFCCLTLPDARREAIASHHARNPKGKHGTHDYSLAEFGLDSDWVRDRFATYMHDFVAPHAGAAGGGRP